ncbi:hypothetical protein ACCAA_10089 [Candidatus Accumulibacter aalborgensis]|uniref:Uncharacterized protein n=1 Tax=Candidatus Accumulibacter aalborgensis TaxID=1860102 RepID=A0A1A8XEI0_9PROT|nr:hypothetical protein ACCAA_10089 [Candidatus Accumulibacter aalborgensis]
MGRVEFRKLDRPYSNAGGKYLVSVSLYPPRFIPSLTMMLSAGQKRVKPLCSRFAPTKTVNHRKYFDTNSGLSTTPRASEMRMKLPAMMRTARSVVMSDGPF